MVIQTTNFTHRPVSHLLSFRLLITSQSIADDFTITRQLGRDHVNSDIDFIHGDIHSRSCKKGFYSTFLKKFPLDKLELSACWRYFCRYVKDKPQRPKFVGHFGCPNEPKFRFSTILLKSFLWIHIGIALYAHWSYFRRCVQSGPEKPNFWAIWSPSQIVFSGFTSVLLHQVLSVVCELCLRPNSGFIVGPKISHNSGFWSSLPKVVTAFTSVLLYLLIVSNCRCMENMVLRDPAFGPVWAPK